jgi:parvulin-like peptidyl-prolyl isomerase
MLNLKARKKFIIVFCTIGLCLVCSCRNSDDNLLARIGSRTITMDDFVQRYHSARQKMNLPDNGQVRMEIFGQMIDEALLISEAESRGYRTDPSGRYESEKIAIQELINMYLESRVFTSIRVQESDLKSLFINLNSMIKARHLYADSKRRADSLYHQLIQGNSFEDLARDIFQDPQLRDTGGLLGYFTVDEMDPGFEETAFALPIGEISKPVRTAQGYSIIQVLDRRTKPMLIESDFAKHRDKLETYWIYRLRKKAVRCLSDSIRHELNISFNQDVLQEFFKFLHNASSDFAAEKIESVSINDTLAGKVIVNSAMGAWTIRDLQQRALFTSEEQRNWIGNYENLEDFIAGLVIRSYILAEAKKMNLHTTDEYRTLLGQKMDDYLLQRMQKTISAGTVIPEDSLRSYYTRHHEQYVSPPRIHLSEIVLDDEATAGKVKDLLIQNTPFEQLVHSYSVRRGSVEQNGEIGIYTRQELGIHADRLMQLAEGQWTGPIRINEQYLFFKCLNRTAGHDQSYAEARSLIQKGLQPLWEEQQRQIFLRKIHSAIKPVTYPEKLKSIQLN